MKKLEMTEELKSILQSVRDGEIYAHIESVSQSGMSRRILFFRIQPIKKIDRQGRKEKSYLQRITAEIGWLSGELKQGENKQGGKWVYDEGLRVNGCGMDMILNTLYNCMPYEQAKNWNQQYNTL